MRSSALSCALILLILLPVGSCRQQGMDGSATAPVPPAQGVEAGPWGGDHIGMEVSENGATVEFDCAHGTIVGPLLLDEQGSFATDGLYFQEHGGPVSDKGEPVPVKVRFEGQVAGGRMNLIVINLDTQEKIGAYTLDFGAAAQITKCL